MLLVAAVLLAAAFLLGSETPSIWGVVQANVDGWRSWSEANPLAAPVAFFLLYAAATSLPLPVVTIMTLLAGALFGRTTGTAIACLAYTTGVTVSFLVSRSLLRDRVRRRAGPWLGRFERGIERDGGFYLLTLRLMPSVPFYLVNVLMAPTPIRTRTFAAISMIGVLPLTFLYAGVGTEIANLASPGDVLSARILLSLTGIALLPLAVRKLLRLRRPEDTLEAAT
jgi:uncharacterized membrane protein YdjX (TVP38/TMEM64 family)